MTETPPRLPTPEERRWDAGDLLANRPFIICALYLCTYVFGVTFIIGVVLAYVFREGQAEEWELSHFTYLIRTFWIMALTLILWAGLAVATFMNLGEGLGWLVTIFVGLFVLLVFILTLARIIHAMLNSVRGKAMPRPRTLFV